MKLVDSPKRNWFDKFCTPMEQVDRENRYARMARQLRDALEALDGEEFTEWMTFSDYSAQDIDGMCEHLDRNSRQIAYLNRRTIKFLRKLKPKRIWTGRVALMHELKSWPEFFEPVNSGAKTAELRYNDRNYQVDDILVLQEWDPNTKSYTGRECRRRVTHVLHGCGTVGVIEPMRGLNVKFVMLSLRELPDDDDAETAA